MSAWNDPAEMARLHEGGASLYGGTLWLEMSEAMANQAIALGLAPEDYSVLLTRCARVACFYIRDRAVREQEAQT